MKISVITPSYNQVQFLPDNLRTVSQQKGIELEHIIVDPGSTDGSTELAQKAKHAILLNEPDRGQSHGITKGYAMSTGDVVVWLNSDDFYPSDDVLKQVADAFEQNPDADVIYGNVNFVDENGNFLRKGFVNKDGPGLLSSFQYQVGIVQPGVFMRRKVFEAVGGPSEDYHYCMDYEYWVRIAQAGFKWKFVDKVFAHHRWWDGMKTSSGRGDSLIEHFKVGMTYFGYIHHKWLDRYGEFIATNSDGVVNHAVAVDEAKKRACVRLAIERFVTQETLQMLHKATEKEKVDTFSYISEIAPDLKQIFFDLETLQGALNSHPDPLAESRVAWHVFDTKTQDGREFKTYRVPENFSRSFDSDWYNYQCARAVEHLERKRQKRKAACVIVANGPSLNLANFDHLEAADVIISNFSVISNALLRHATYLTVVNDLVAKQGSVVFNNLEITKVLPFWLANSINPVEGTFFVPATVEPKFCGDLGGIFSWRSTVSFLNMQLAFALGYEKVILIGFDHSYQQAAALKEGDSINQREEDPNHFDPRYFQGKIWQAADTGNMEKMYLVARDAYAAAGRTIVNATVGGKLEVFPRQSLEDALGLNKKQYFLPKSVSASAYPRLAIFDMTAMGNGTATGEIKSNLLADWPDAAVLQVAKAGKTGLGIIRKAGDSYSVAEATAAEVGQAIDTFAPDVVLYRPVPDTDALHKLAMSEIARLKKPLITWIMDDWPARMEAEKPEEWARLKPDLLSLLAKSELNLSICESMSEAFVRRYAQGFIPLANGIDPSDWPVPAVKSGKDFTLRYSGGLAPDMNQKSVLRVAAAVERLAANGHTIRFEISTQQWWLDQSKDLFAAYKQTSLSAIKRSMADYRRWIQGADGLLIAYNFDDRSLRYVQYSMANKMPECLASGVAVLAHGPRTAATIAYLAGKEAAQIVDQPSDEELEQALLQLLNDQPARQGLANRAREVALESHNIHKLREFLRDLINRSVARTASAPNDSTGAELAHLRKSFSALEAHSRGLEQQLATETSRRPLALPAGRPLLEGLAEAVLAGSGSAAAGMFLQACSAALLTEAKVILPRLAKGADLELALSRALENVDKHNVAYTHFQKAMAFAGHAIQAKEI